MRPIIKPQDILPLLQQENLVLLDVRTGADAAEKYKAAHLQGALFVDLETDLAQKETDAAHGGRHPLPDIHKFAALLGQLGISPGSHVVVYDDKQGANAAARLWWMLRAIGHEHEQVQVLDGGYDAAVAAGVPVNSGTEQPATYPPYPHHHWLLPTADMKEVEQAAQVKDKLVIDVRSAERFRGETEPIDLVAGHIPGAVNMPYTANLDSNGFFLPATALHQKYTDLLGNRPADQVIVHCGSGVTACHTLLAMAQAGMDIPKLYVGSWSEWSRRGKPVATGA